MDVDANQSSGSASHGKTVANSAIPHRAFVAITPYNPNPQSPRGKEIVSQIRRVSPALIRSFVAGSSSVPCVFREGAASAPSDPLVLPPGDLLEVTEARPAGGYALAPGLAAVVSPPAADPPAQQGSPGADVVGVGGSTSAQPPHADCAVATVEMGVVSSTALPPRLFLLRRMMLRQAGWLLRHLCRPVCRPTGVATYDILH